MAEVLVLAEHTADGEVKKVTLELLTAARRLGSPSVVWTGPGSDAGIARLGEYGAEKVYVADSPDFSAYVVAPAAELLAQLVSRVSRWVGWESSISRARSLAPLCHRKFRSSCCRTCCFEMVSRHPNSS